MDLLKYEFMNAPEGSYNANVAELVRLVRHYRSNVTIDEFREAIPAYIFMRTKKNRNWYGRN